LRMSVRGDDIALSTITDPRFATVEQCSLSITESPNK